MNWAWPAATVQSGPAPNLARGPPYQISLALDRSGRRAHSATGAAPGFRPVARHPCARRPRVPTGHLPPTCVPHLLPCVAHRRSPFPFCLRSPPQLALLPPLFCSLLHLPPMSHATCRWSCCHLPGIASPNRPHSCFIVLHKKSPKRHSPSRREGRHHRRPPLARFWSSCHHHEVPVDAAPPLQPVNHRTNP
jgi:hypothetical protein